MNSNHIRLVSRRYFLKKTIKTAAGGALTAGSLGGCTLFSLDSMGESASSSGFNEETLLPAGAAGQIERVSADESTCASCGMCSLVCAAVHGDASGPLCFGIWLDRKPFDCEYTSITCHQCDAPECYFACEESAFYIDKRTGARTIDAKKCVGCGQCVDACVFDISRIRLDEAGGVAFKCDLCSNRPQGPACVEFCPRQALIFIREA